MKRQYIPPKVNILSIQHVPLLSGSSGNPSIDTGGDNNPDVSDKSESQSGGRAKAMNNDTWSSWE